MLKINYTCRKSLHLGSKLLTLIYLIKLSETKFIYSTHNSFNKIYEYINHKCLQTTDYGLWDYDSSCYSGLRFMFL